MIRRFKVVRKIKMQKGSVLELIVSGGRVEETGGGGGEVHLILASEHSFIRVYCSLCLGADLFGSLTEVRLFSLPQWRSTREDLAGPFQQPWPPVNFMLECLKWHA